MLLNQCSTARLSTPPRPNARETLLTEETTMKIEKFIKLIFKLKTMGIAIDLSAFYEDMKLFDPEHFDPDVIEKQGTEDLWLPSVHSLEHLLVHSCHMIAGGIMNNLDGQFDEENKTFVEPYLPNYKIGIMHLAAGIWKDNKDMRLDKDIKIDIKTLTGKILNKSLRFNN